MPEGDADRETGAEQEVTDAGEAGEQDADAGQDEAGAAGGVNPEKMQAVYNRGAKETREAMEGKLEEQRETINRLESKLDELTSDSQSGGETPEGAEDSDLYTEEQVRELKRSYQEELEDVRSEAERLRTEKLDREVVEAASELGVRKGLIRLVKRFYRDQMGYSEEHAEWFRQDREGFEPSVDDDFETDYVTVAEDLAQRKKSGEFADWFESSTREGGGYGGTDGGGGTPKKRKSEMSDEEKREFIAEHGHEAYGDLPL